MKHPMMVGLTAFAVALSGFSSFAYDPGDYSTWMQLKPAKGTYGQAVWYDPADGTQAVVAPESGKCYYSAWGKTVESASFTDSFPGVLTVADTIYLNGAFTTHTIPDLTILDRGTFKTKANVTHNGKVTIRGAVRYATATYSSRIWYINAAFASGDEAILNFGNDYDIVGRSPETVQLNGSWADFAGTLNVMRGTYVLFGGGVSLLAGTLTVQPNAYVKSAKTSGAFDVGGLRLENGGVLMFDIANGGTVQYVVNERLEILGNPIIDVQVPAGMDHLDLIKLTGEAAVEANLPDVSALRLPETTFAGPLPKCAFSIVDGEAEDEKFIRLSWTPFKCMTKANDYTKAAGSALTLGNDDFWTPTGVPAVDEPCTARVDAVLTTHAYGPIDYPNLTLCFRDKTFFINADRTWLSAVYFDGNCTLSGSAHAGGTRDKKLQADIHINGRLTVDAWGGPVRGIIGAIHGQGEFVVGHDASGCGILLEGEGSDFVGQYCLYGFADSYDSKPARFITIGNGFNFGGTYSGEAPVWQSTVVSNAYVVLNSNVMINEPTRGLYFFGGPTVEVPNGLSLSILNDVTVEGRLVKRGAGELALGNSSVSFANGGIRQEVPVAGKNELFIEEGSLKVLRRDAVNGLKVRFGEAAKWKIDFDSTDYDFRDYGVVNTLCVTPFEGSASGIVLEVAGSDLPPEETSMAICTVSSSAPVLAFTHPPQINNRDVRVTTRNNPDDSVTYILTLAAKRGLMFLIKNKSLP